MQAPSTTAKLTDFVTRDELISLVELARAEDMHHPPRDLTSELTIDAGAHCDVVLHSRGPGVVAGVAAIELILEVYDAKLKAELSLPDGASVQAGDVIASIHGPTRSVLAAERVLLNLLCHLSGMATLTAQFVQAVQGTPASICDTRKTIPGLRHLAKFAVACGGGTSHRMGLYDAVLIKDNHLAARADEPLAQVVGEVTQRARSLDPAPLFVEVELDDLTSLKDLLQLQGPQLPDIILLDNMEPAQLSEAVATRDQLAQGVLLEASGGVSLSTVRSIAETGVDRISVGAITHSAPVLDMGLDALSAGTDR